MLVHAIRSQIFINGKEEVVDKISYRMSERYDGRAKVMCSYKVSVSLILNDYTCAVFSIREIGQVSFYTVTILTSYQYYLF